MKKYNSNYVFAFVVSIVTAFVFFGVMIFIMPKTLATATEMKTESKTRAVEINEENLLDAIKLLVDVTPMIPVEEAAEIEIEPAPFYPITDSERYMLECIVCGEAGNQEYNGKVAVASCILNAALKDDISIHEVRKQYQYSGWKDINKYEAECMSAYGNTKLADEVRQAVEQVFDNGEVISKDILWFYNPDIVYSHFHETKTKFYFKIDDMKFFGPKE